MPRIITAVMAHGKVVQSVNEVPPLDGDTPHRAAIVLGAGLVGEAPSPLLRSRIDSAIKLLHANRVDMLIMSGDNSTEYYDEPTVMRRYAIDHGALVYQVAADYAGRRTWDSCARARKIFGIKDAIVVTSSFHVDRAMVTCKAAGAATLGFSSSDSKHTLRNRLKWRVRELAASARALFDVWVVRPEPAVGGDPINPWDACELRDSLAPSDAKRDADAFARFNCHKS